MSTPQNNNPILGYVLCKDCMSPKSVRQGSGKRAAYFVGRCECGTDNKTAKVPQSIMSQFKPLEDVEAELAAINTPVIKDEPQMANNEPNKAETLPIDGQSLPKPINQDEQTEPNANTPFLLNAACVGIGCGLGWVVGKAFSVLRAA